MDKHTYTETFGDNNAITVSVINNVKAGTSDTTTVSIEANTHTFTLEVSQLPSDHELQDMADWVKTSIDTSLKGATDNELIRLSEQVHLHLQQVITFRAKVAITGNEVDTDIEWILLNFKGKKRASDGQYHGFIPVCLMSGNKAVQMLNANQLYRRLDNHPGTPIYHTSDVECFERGLDGVNATVLHETLGMKTTAQRVKSKIALANNDKLLFTKKGMPDPQQPPKNTAVNTH